MPDLNGRKMMALLFEKDSLLPGVVGAVDGSFIPIPAPSEDQESYFNRKKFHSIILQEVAGPDMKILDCNIGWPGSVHDSRVLRNSLLLQNSKDLFAPHFYLLGDAAYPIKPWLMVPYKNNGKLSQQQLKFNKTLGSMKVVVEQAFGLIKGRFRRLKFLDIRDLTELIQTVFICCILHNLCLTEPQALDYLATEPES